MELSRMSKQSSRESRLYAVVESVRSKEFSHLSADLTRKLLETQIEAVSESEPVNETRKLLEAEARRQGAQ
jgi:hypothetical protein